MRSARQAAASASAAAVVALPAVAAGLGSAPDTATGQEPPPADPVGQPPPPAEDPQVAKLRWQLRRMTRRAYRYKLHVRKLRRAFRLQISLGANGIERGFLCIHRFEGAWSDRGAPYWGGLQMDRSFMASYGGEFLRAFGTADNWTPAMQLAVAERAYLSGRGYGPWPTTRRLCGL